LIKQDKKDKAGNNNYKKSYPIFNHCYAVNS